MPFGLPSAEEMRDYLISQGVDPAVATARANAASQQNAAQAARTSALSILAGAAPARAAGTAAVEAAPAAGRAAMSVAERVAAAPRNVWEYLTVPQGVIRNPTTGARIPGRHPAGTLSPTGEKIGGQTFRQPDYFLPGQNLAQGVAGATALGAGAAGVGALTDRPIAASMPVMPMDGSISGEEGGGTSYQRALMDSSISGEEGGGTSYLGAAQAAGERAGLPPARPTDAALQIARERAAPPMPQRRPEGLGDQPGGLSRLFSDPYAGQSARQMYEKAQEMERSGDESGANIMNLRAAKASGEGMASGGAAKPHKDAALHKALDIISHMLSRR